MGSRSRSRRYRLDFVAENTDKRIWSVRMGRAKVWIAATAAIAALIALIFVIVAYTPVRQLLPGALSGDLRSRYQTSAVRADSLAEQARINQQYLSNIERILRGEDADTLPDISIPSATPNVGDTLPLAGEAERAFVRAFDEENRFNLSVLAPLAAEGMVFNPPVAVSAQTTPAQGGGVSINPRRAVPVSAVYRGTVTGVYFSPEGTSTIAIQHPNDFVSVYSGVGDVFVERGQRVEPGQRIAHTSTRNPMVFELWHRGTGLDPREYMAF